MSSSVSQLIGNSAKLALILVGLLLTVVFAPALVAGLAAASDIKSEFPFFAAACCGLIGIISAWARVLLGSKRLRKAPVLRWSLCCGLFLGTVLAIWLVAGVGFKSGNPVSLAYFCAAIVGVLLLMGTVRLHHATAT
ncbi:MAG: hypothetical protein V4567_11240 [Pseudomonadota bacterium]